MNLNTFYQVCIYITVGMILFTLSFNFVAGLDVYDTTAEHGLVPGDNTNETFMNLTESPEFEGGMVLDNIWTFVLAGGIGAIVVAGITRSPIILGVYIFSFVFWTSYGNTLSIINIGGYIPAGFLLIGTVGMAFIFVGAIAGMLGGSG